MRLPVRLNRQSTAHKLMAATLIALVAYAVCLAGRQTWPFSIPLSRLDDLLYDSTYRLRRAEDRSNGPVIILAVDDKSLHEIDEEKLIRGKRQGWPWPREYWGLAVKYLNACGAKAIVFDLLFQEQSLLEEFSDDDEQLAKAVNNSKVPVLFATMARPKGGPGPFAPPVKNPILCATNIKDDVVLRSYTPIKSGVPSLAAQAVTSAFGVPLPSSERPFLLHYYGPHLWPDGRRTYRYIAASRVIAAADGAKNTGVSREMFKDKIVLIGAIAPALYDLKSSPLSALYPGTEYHATAIDNLIERQQVLKVPLVLSLLIGVLASLGAAVGVILPRPASVKLAAAFVAISALLATAVILFLGRQIYWFPLAAPLVAVVVATIASFAWSYLTEDRQRRIIFRALSQSLSPAMAEEIQRNPDKLNLGGERRTMTVMFTDLAGFTDLSENMESEKLTALMNFYLEQMSSIVLGKNGYLDKYIGDAIMSFWNAPIDQPDHAILACRTALALREREIQIQPELQKLANGRLLTRIGINTGPMSVGNLGCSFKFAYTVLGDSVNLASRLEGANKLYGSQILMAHSTAELVKEHFVLRQLDKLRVKGKQKPMAVYELMGDSGVDGELRVRASEYEAALGFYQQQQWDEAEARLARLHDRFPADASAVALTARIQKLRHDPPGEGWDGVYVAKDK